MKDNVVVVGASMRFFFASLSRISTPVDCGEVARACCCILFIVRAGDGGPLMKSLAPVSQLGLDRPSGRTRVRVSDRTVRACAFIESGRKSS